MAQNDGGTRPGWGFGDKNHVHTGPPGQSVRPGDINTNNASVENNVEVYSNTGGNVVDGDGSVTTGNANASANVSTTVNQSSGSDRSNE